jgi:outer membrane protein assembly factor BamB
VLLTEPIGNYFGLDPGGEARREGNTLMYDALYLNLTLDGDTLTGTYPGPNSPATLRRARKLPTQLDPPRVPAGPEARWHTRLNGQVWASPVAYEGTIYIGSTGGVFNAVDARDGRHVWAFAAGRPIFGAAAVDADAVYFACDNGWLFKLDRATGKELWRYDLGDARVSRVLGHPNVFEWDWQGAQPVLGDGSVFVGSGDGGFHAVDAKTGLRQWRFDTRAAIRNAAALDATHVFVGSTDHHVYALERKTGKETWRFDTGAHVDAAPVVHDGRVLVGNRGPGLFSLDAASGEQKWRLFFWGSWVESTPVVVDGTIYIGSSDLRRVSAIDPADGKVKWRSDVYGWTFGTPLVDGDRIHVGAAGGTPYMFRHLASYTTLDRASGRILTRRPLPDGGGHQWGVPGTLALAGDTVVFATISGSLYGYPRR